MARTGYKAHPWRNSLNFVWSGSAWVPETQGGGSGGGGGQPSATATLTSVADNASNVQLLAANAARLNFVLVNESSASVNVKCGVTASATSYTRRLAPGEVLKGQDLGVNWLGEIDGIWDSAPGGAMRITEFTT